jgi:hypothetical protein
LTAQLQQIQGLDAAYLVRKHMRHLPQQPFYVLGFKARSPAMVEAVRKELLARVYFPGDTLLLPLQVSAKAHFAHAFRRMPSAKIL